MEHTGWVGVALLDGTMTGIVVDPDTNDFATVRTLEAGPEDTAAVLAVERLAFSRDDQHGAGVQLLFVLGAPGYYTRCGFVPATPHGLHAPHPIVPEAAWMVRAVAPGVLGTVEGRVRWAATLDRPEYWRE